MSAPVEENAARPNVRTDDHRKRPPTLLYLPPLMVSKSSGPAIAEMIATRLTLGPGTFGVRALSDSEPTATLKDGRRIVRADGDAVLDVFTYDYIPHLLRSAGAEEGRGLFALLKRLLRQLQYFARSALLLRGAFSRAKGATEKFELVYGVALVMLMLLTVILAFIAVVEAALLALGMSDSFFAVVDERFDQALAIGLTAAAAWILLRLRPIVDQAARFIAQILDYVQNERHAATVCGGLRSALDELLEEDPSREIHVFGYSFGSIVAVDFLFPKISLRENPDPRVPLAVRSLSTVGCPLDFVRLYEPNYLTERAAVVDNLRWTNIFIPADVMGSNFHVRARGNGENDAVTDATEEPPSGLKIVNENRVSRRYTNQRLSFWGAIAGRGFHSHATYWGAPDEANCLDMVINTIGLTSSHSA